MKDEDRPSREIWLDDELLADHFETVSARYADGTDGDEVVPMDQNEMTRVMKKGKR